MTDSRHADAATTPASCDEPTCGAVGGGVASRCPERRTHDYVRHGTSTLFAALDIATGNVTGTCKPRHRHQAFLEQVARAYPDDGSGTELHLVMDNYATYKRVEVRDWLAANPRIKIHFTPTSGSWLNMIEV